MFAEVVIHLSLSSLLLETCLLNDELRSFGDVAVASVGYTFESVLRSNPLHLCRLPRCADVMAKPPVSTLR